MKGEHIYQAGVACLTLCFTPRNSQSKGRVTTWIFHTPIPARACAEGETQAQGLATETEAESLAAAGPLAEPHPSAEPSPPSPECLCLRNYCGCAGIIKGEGETQDDSFISLYNPRWIRGQHSTAPLGQRFLSSAAGGTQGLVKPKSGDDCRMGGAG